MNHSVLSNGEVLQAFSLSLILLEVLSLAWPRVCAQMSRSFNHGLAIASTIIVPLICALQKSHSVAVSRIYSWRKLSTERRGLDWLVPMEY